VQRNPPAHYWASPCIRSPTHTRVEYVNEPRTTTVLDWPFEREEVWCGVILRAASARLHSPAVDNVSQHSRRRRVHAHKNGETKPTAPGTLSGCADTERLRHFRVVRSDLGSFYNILEPVRVNIH
jgi:hypothetical protein